MVILETLLQGLTLSGPTTSVRNSAYAGDVSVLVTSSAEDKEVSKESKGMRANQRPKLTMKSSVGLGLST